MLCTLPPKCILLQQDSTTGAIFPEMGSTAVPVFCVSESIKVGNMSITRDQVPVTPAWAMTDYKVLGLTCQAVTADLNRPKINGKTGSSHQQYCSNNVQLTRVRTIEDLFLLRPVTLKDLSCKPHHLLLAEDQRLEALAISTDIAWNRIECSNIGICGPLYLEIQDSIDFE